VHGWQKQKTQQAAGAKAFQWKASLVVGQKRERECAKKKGKKGCYKQIIESGFKKQVI